MAVPSSPMDGTEAVHASVQGGEMTMAPVLLQMTPSTEAAKVQLKIPALA